MEDFILRGKVVAVLGDNIDTDIIYPGRYLNITDKKDTAEHAFELAYPEIKKKMEPGDFIVAAKNFGCGSSREQATAALKYSGFGGIIASSFARIFFRNSLNLGLPLISSQDAYKVIKEGDELEIDLLKGIINDKTSNTQIVASPLDEKAVLYLKEGGLIPYLRKKYSKK